MRAPNSEGKNRLAGVVTSLDDWHSTYESDGDYFYSMKMLTKALRSEYFMNRWL